MQAVQNNMTCHEIREQDVGILLHAAHTCISNIYINTFCVISTECDFVRAVSTVRAQ